MRPELKPCPFCGGKGMYRDMGWAITAGCEVLHAESPQFPTAQEAADWWNRRKNPSGWACTLTDDQKAILEQAAQELLDAPPDGVIVTPIGGTMTMDVGKKGR